MIKNISTILSGSIVAQLIMLVTMPILSRLYDAEVFGKYQIYISTLSVLLMASTLRYEVALLLSKSDRNFFYLLKVVFFLCLVISIIFLFAFWLSKNFIVVEFPDLAEVFYILPFAMFFGGIYQATTYLPIKKRNYTLSTSAKIVQSLTYAVSSIILAFSPILLVGMMVSDIISKIVSSWWILKENLKLMLKLKISKKKIKYILYKNREYPLITFPGTLLSSISMVMMPILLFNKFDMEAVGQYALFDRFILFPIGMIAAAVSQVYTGDFSEKIRLGHTNLTAIFRKTILWLSLVALPPATILFFNADWIIPIIFGKQWGLAGQLCAVAIPIAFITFVVSPVNMVLIICNKQKLQFSWELLRFISIITLFTYLYNNNKINIIESITLYSTVLFVVYIIYIIIADNAIKEKALIQ